MLKAWTHGRVPQTPWHDIWNSNAYSAIGQGCADEPETHYALSGEGRIAYQVIGGPFDLVLVPGYISNLDHTWEEPSLVH